MRPIQKPNNPLPCSGSRGWPVCLRGRNRDVTTTRETIDKSTATPIPITLIVL